MSIQFFKIFAIIYNSSVNNYAIEMVTNLFYAIFLGILYGIVSAFSIYVNIESSSSHRVESYVTNR